MISSITPLILTYNEAPNIKRTLDNLKWAKKVIIVDSFSTDNTIEIISKYSNTEVFQHPFVSFAKQCNYGLSKIEEGWVLSMDADYIITEELLNCIRELDLDTKFDGFKVRFKYCIFGKPLFGTLLPPRKVLYKREKARYVEDGHAHQVKVFGKIGELDGYIYHDDRKDLSRWISAQDRYMKLEAIKISKISYRELSWGDSIRKLKIVAPFIIFFYCLIIKGGILDGWRGWFYAFQRMFAELLLSLRLIEEKFVKN